MPTLTKYRNIIDGKPIHIATVTPNGHPNLAVASDVAVLDDNHLMISVNEMKRTPENIQQNPQVVITAFDEDWKGVRIFGVAKFHTGGKYYDLCKEEFFANGEVTPFGAIAVEVTEIEELV